MQDGGGSICLAGGAYWRFQPNAPPASPPSLLELHLLSFLLGHWPHLVDSASIAVYIAELERVDNLLLCTLGSSSSFVQKGEDKEEAEE